MKLDNFTFTEHMRLATLSTKDGVTKELNIISYNGYPPKYDLRGWNNTSSRIMQKGLTLTASELSLLKQAIDSIADAEGNIPEPKDVLRARGIT